MYQCDYTIILLGDTEVGKTALLEKYVDNKPCHLYNPTLGVDFKTKIINVNGIMYKLKILDVSGSNKFSKITTPYVENIDACVIMFDITNISSMKSIKKWLSLVQSKNSYSIPIIIVANKFDTHHSRHFEPYVDTTIFNHRNFINCSFIQTSVKTGYNVEQIFITLVQQLASLKNVSFHKFEKTDPPKKSKLFHCCINSA